MLIFSLSVPKHVSPDIARSGVLAGVALHFVNVGDGDKFCRSLSSSEVRILLICWLDIIIISININNNQQ